MDLEALIMKSNSDNPLKSIMKLHTLDLEEK